MQFGHNDMKNHATNALENYKANYVKVIGEIRAKGATPVIIASMERANGANQDTLMGYPAAALETAAAQNVASIDLHSMSQVFYRALGDDVKKAFNDGITHHNNYGSYEISKMVVMGIKADKLDIAKYIVPDFQDFDPAHPDPLTTFKMALSAGSNAQRPLGDESTFCPGAGTNASATPAAKSPENSATNPPNSKERHRKRTPACSKPQLVSPSSRCFSRLPRLGRWDGRGLRRKRLSQNPVTGLQLEFLTSTDGGYTQEKIYQTHRQWTADGKWLIFRDTRATGSQAFAVNEESGQIVQVTENGFMGCYAPAIKP